MGVVTGISWAHHTFNPWHGCSHKSPGCRFCYADRDSRRWRGKGAASLFRRHGPRRFMSDGYWREPAKWNRAARQAGEPARVFSGSMCDVFEDRRDLDEPRARLWETIDGTPWLIWMLLTKRPEDVPHLAPPGWAALGWPPNVWLGASAETERYARERIELLAATGAHTRFLSCEPLLGPIDLRYALPGWEEPCDGGCASRLGAYPCDCPNGEQPAGPDWVIAGGESGPSARPTELEWLISLQDQCAVGGVPFHLKQLGEPLARALGCSSRAGRDPAEWPYPFTQDFPMSGTPA